jgi:hypothetical protein
MKRHVPIAVLVVVVLFIVNLAGDEWRGRARAYLRAMRHIL